MYTYTCLSYPSLSTVDPKMKFTMKSVPRTVSSEKNVLGKSTGVCLCVSTESLMGASITMLG